MRNIFLITLLLRVSFCGAQNIYTYAGTGVSGYSGDGGLALNSKMDPFKICVDGSGNVYIVDAAHHCVRKVNASGIISTFAGTGVSGFSGDGALATGAQLDGPSAVVSDLSGNIYISDQNNNRVRKVDASGVISTYVGNGSYGFGGDGGMANLALLKAPNGMAIDLSGNLYIADQVNNRIRKVNSAGIISTFAGNGGSGFSGDGGLATNAPIVTPSGVATDATGNVYITDQGNNRIRLVNTSGIISTFAGTSSSGFSGDGGPATSAQLFLPVEVAVDISGNVYVADFFNNRIRKINTLGIISTMAGASTAGYSGDGGAASLAKLNAPQGIAIDPSSNIYIVDRNNYRIREICTSNCSAGILQLKGMDQIFVSPNPNHGLFKLKIDNEIENGEMILVNSLGQKVFEQKIAQGENDVNVKHVGQGLYNCILLKDKVQISQRKIVIE